ncbi:DUF1003 domain-containing protein [Breznakia pachnodae]|uniref:Membrane protein n=1 Tax=Breznakia pachnodae TaxID=265178 RepID=A0ABU0E6L2_9FIRM|nr:DUF1003 domain-containing protein [Breznakia pachnodae]MDQ0362348.1 putative membrane protein [Breznakia pachnodae]
MKVEQNKVKLNQLPQNIKEELMKEHPEYTEDMEVDYNEVMDYHLQIIERQLQQQSNLIGKSDKRILKSIQNNEFITKEIHPDDSKLTTGQKAADAIAKFGGSWGFIITFIVVLIVWIGLNATALLFKAFDPYPFILLNLLLSCLAAIQAPIIMMSQNRQEDHDREQSVHDYEVNLKSEIEVRLLHEKMDHLIYAQMKQLLEMQQLQMEYLKEIKKSSQNE